MPKARSTSTTQATAWSSAASPWAKKPSSRVKAAPSGASLTLETGAAGTAGGDIRLLSEKNTFDDVTVRAADAAKGIDGTIQLKTTAPNTGKTSGTDGLTVTFGEGSDTSSPL